MFTKRELNSIEKAKKILEKKITNNPIFTSSSTARDFCQLALAHHEKEVFGVIFLDNKSKLIKFEKMFFGTITFCNVYARFIVKRALELSAVSVLFSHNHPSDSLAESEDDLKITKSLKSCLKLFDIQVLDHIIVTKKETLSLAEKGLL